MVNNPYEKNIKTKCAVCRKEVLIDQFGQGLCNNCGWEQDINSLDYPDKVIYPNRVSYIKAVLLFGKGRPLLPSFDDFIKMFDFYGELELKYKGRWFGLTASNGHTLEFFEQKIMKFKNMKA
ncbi:MAG: CPCC family cysteine-rich protein [Clostridia bacterium]|nr:CPCC family cysteine-rich protein [Clostridia bacterium]